MINSEKHQPQPTELNSDFYDPKTGMDYVPESQAMQMLASPDNAIMGFKIDRDEDGNAKMEGNWSRKYRGRTASFTGTEAMEGEVTHYHYRLSQPNAVVRAISRAVKGRKQEPEVFVQTTELPSRKPD